MEIRLLDSKWLRTEEFYYDFLAGKIAEREEYFTEEYISIEQAPDFPVYLNIKNEENRKKRYLEAIDVISKYYINTDRDIHMNDMFWFTLLCVHKRDYLLTNYPEIRESISKFNNIVIKKFDWENYIYKCILASQYVVDNIFDEQEQKKYFELIIDNLDMFNYIIKYEIFRNDKFLLNVLRMIDKHNLSSILKMQIKGREDLGEDERVGRRVLLELNKMYPVIVIHAMEFEDFESVFMEEMRKYVEK